MKTLSLVLGAFVLILSGLLYLNGSRAERHQHVAQTQVATLSNQVTELGTRLVLETVKASTAQSTAESNLAQLVHQVRVLSNNLVQVQSHKANTQSALHAAQSELAANKVQIEELQGHLATAKASVQTLTVDAAQLDAVRTHLVATQRRLSAATEELGILRVQYADVTARLEDENFLRLQSARAREMAKVRQRQATPRPAAPDRRAPLLLLPDGTVRVAVQDLEPAPGAGTRPQ